MAVVEPDDAGSSRDRRLFPSMVTASPTPSRRKRASSSLRRASTAAAAVTTSPVTTTATAVGNTTVKRGGAGAAGAGKGGTIRHGSERSRDKLKSALGASATKQGNSKNNNKTKKMRRKKKDDEARRTRGKAFVIVCDAESVTHPELLDCINIVEKLGARDVGMIYADWSVTLVRPSASCLPRPTLDFVCICMCLCISFLE